VAAALETALSSLSDPATLTWLLRTIELAGVLRGTIGISSIENVPTLAGGPYAGWRLVAAVERRVMFRPVSLCG
jgi:hypothetical protein